MTTFHYRPDERHKPRRHLSAEPETRAAERGRATPSPIEELERRRCPSPAPGLAAAAIDLPVDPNVSRVESARRAIGAIDLYQVNVDTDGLFVAQVQAQGFDTRLSLLDGQGQLLIQSEASSPQDPDDRVAMHLTAGDYFLMVQDLTGSGSYTLATSFTDAIAPAQPLAGNSGAYSVAVADLTGNKIPDLIVADLYVDQVLVYLGAGDGTFQPPIALPVGRRSGLRHDGRPDRQRHPGHHHRQPGLERRVGLAGQRRRHVPARDRGPGGPGPVERGGRRLQRRRPPRPGRHRLVRR